MEKGPIIFVFVFVLTLSFIVTDAYAQGVAKKGFEKGYLTSEVIGSKVKNLRGEDLGKISNVVFVEGGRVAFVIVSHGGRKYTHKGGILELAGTKVAIPFEAFKFDPEGEHWVLDINKERLASAPTFKEGILRDREAATDVYRYFGVHPYWEK